ncbi:MAG: PHP domain-containing protein [Myxococcales bacterium]|nr:PHP domain-containing protein [Myxococcales bacterium]
MFVATDLHGHTHFSDGRATPEEYVELRRQLGMKAIAICDHDVLGAVRRGAEAAARANMLFLPAMEVTSFLHFGTERAEQFHVLAYFPASYLDGYRLEQTALYRRGMLVQERWKELVLEWLSEQEASDREALDGAAEGASLEKLPAPLFPALQSMILRIVERRRPLFESFRDRHVSFWEGERNRDLFAWSPEEAIETIRGDGALDIVAHPARYRDKARTEAVLEHASGLEVYTSRHKAEVAARFRELADTKKKLWTASSDDHQNAPYARPPSGTPVRTLERMCHRAMPVEWILS